MENQSTLNKRLSTTVGILVLLVIAGLVGLFFYNGIPEEEYVSAPITTVEFVPKPQEIPVPESEQDLQILEKELESMTAEVDENDIFGLEELDAELAELAGFDDLLIDEVVSE